LSEQFTIAIIAALAAIGGALIGACASLLNTWLSKRVSESGRVDVFCRFVHSKASEECFGIYKSGKTNGLVMRIPMWIEIANTSMTPKYIRDFNIIAFNQEIEVAEFTQMQGINLGTEKEQELGNHQMYSFVVDGKEIKRFDVEFILQDANLTDEEKTFTTLKARYFTESGKKIEKVIYSDDKTIAWKIGAISHKKEWISVNGGRKG